MNSFEEIELYENNKRFLLVPRVVDENDGIYPTKTEYDSIVLVDRQSGEFSSLLVPENQRSTLFTNMKTMTRIFGIVGIVNLLSGSFLIVILDREFVFKVKGNEVFQLKKIQFIPFVPSAFRNQEESVKEREIAYIEMMNKVSSNSNSLHFNHSKVLVEEESFYFSYTCNLTVNFQDQLVKKAQGSNRHFFWNRHLSARLMTSNLPRYVLPMVRGYLEVADCTIHDKTFMFGIISRTSCRRAGTRYNCRGADLKGNVANFVETEHFIEYDGVFTSFRQIRGSIPLVWTQYANLKYTPEIKFLTDKQKQKQAFELHFSDVASSYPGPITALNLCKKKGQEKRLSDVYETFWKNTKFPTNAGVKYIHFDFHSECKNLNFEKLFELMNDLDDNFHSFKYFVERFGLSKDPETWQVQTGKTLTRSLSSTTLSAQTGRVVDNAKTSNNTLSLTHRVSKSVSMFDIQNSSNQDQNFSLNVNKINQAASNNFPERKMERTITNVFDLSDETNQDNNNFHMVNFEENDSKTMQKIAKEFYITDIDDNIRMKNINTNLNLPATSEAIFSPLSPRMTNDASLDPDRFEEILLQEQKGTFRVNCIDCCDRTNVVETYLSRRVLLEQLYAINIFYKKENSFLAYPRFESVFNNFWASNGDKVSLLYAGTQALMGDYTRTGQRSVQGLLNDGVNSAKRYLKNNFTDQQRQRGINLVLGLLDLQSEAEVQAFQTKDIVSELFLL
ncbi:hypothetical protein AKO1_014679 [Acrasis kona]|uniref:SAC domain-containing protein n=1 Tax=Acrasis kona TaxID=1008807 RepID=A0AAW2Z1L2_9EUKA